MQIGSRWRVGDAPPARLPEAVVDAVRQVEAEVAELDTSAWRWTLTYLESRPVVELSDGTVIRLGRDGAVVVVPHDAAVDVEDD